MHKIAINPQTLYEGCILATLAHGVAVGEYPECSDEHLWQGINYCTDYLVDCKAVITFHKKYLVAAFRNDTKIQYAKEPSIMFAGAEKAILQLAREETLHDFHEIIGGESKPAITAAFWGNWQELYSNQSMETLFENGGCLIENQILHYHSALAQWDDNYGFSDGQLQLIDSLYRRKLKSGLAKQIVLSENEANQLYGDLSECRKSLARLNILVP